MADDQDWPWWDTRVSAGTARVAGWLGVALATLGLSMMVLTSHDGLGFAVSTAQFACGAALAVLHFATRRRRVDRAGGSRSAS